MAQRNLTWDYRAGEGTGTRAGREVEYVEDGSDEGLGLLGRVAVRLAGAGLDPPHVGGGPVAGAEFWLWP